MSCLGRIVEDLCGGPRARPDAGGKAPRPRDPSDKWVPGNPGRLADQYSIKKELGEGSFGSVCLVTRKIDKLDMAMKKMDRVDKKTKKTADLEKLKNEVDIMRQMDHPNLIKMYDDMSDEVKIYLMMELCTGGELFDAIIEAQHFSEAQAASVMKQFLNGLNYMHAKSITHRDLKPENLLLKDNNSSVEKNVLKLIDFGLSCKFEKNVPLKTKAGTPYYVSPEVLKGSYDELADVWSAGVIMYVLLSGQPPFYGDNDNQVLDAVRKGTLEFQTQCAVWKEVSGDAVVLIKKMLMRNTKERCTAKDALENVWVRDNAPRAAKVNLSAGLVDNLRKFRSVNKLKKAAIHEIAKVLNEDKLKTLKEQFQAMDVNGDGMLSMQELTEGMKKGGLKQIPEDLQQILKDLDSDKSGQIDYTEFLSAALDKRHYIQRDVCWSAFCHFDKNGDGKLSRDELKLVLESAEAKVTSIKNNNKELDDLIKEVDKDGNGEIDFEEFMQMMSSD